MSTASLSYPEVIRLRRAPAIGRILILSSLVLIAITALVLVTSAHADLPHRATVSQNSISAVAVPVPTPPPADVQSAPSETPAPPAELASGPSAVPVPVPTPPAQ
jgi:hypothetical protein